MPRVTSKAVQHALSLEEEIELYPGTEFDRYATVASSLFSEDEDPSMTRGFFNTFYTSLKKSGDLPDLSYESLGEAQMEIMEICTGMSREEFQEVKRLYWKEGFSNYFETMRQKLTDENPEYLNLTGKASLFRLAAGRSGRLPAMVGMVVYRAMEIELEKEEEKRKASLN